MDLRGTIRNGKVELDAGGNLPEGTQVDVRPVPKSTLVRDLLKFSVADYSLPSDYASQLDHYLYGLAKQGRASAAKKPARNRRSSPSKASGRAGKKRGK
jgi:hypothetical protein